MSAVNENAVSAVVGYKITKGDYSTQKPFLPQRIALLSEINAAITAKDYTPFLATSLSLVAQKMGFGSPAYMAMRILRPTNGGGVDCPVWVYPVASASDATATAVTVTVAGTATATVNHSLIIAGRKNVDGQYFSVSVKKGATATATAAAFVKAINAVVGSPVIATTGSNGAFTITAKTPGISTLFTCQADVNGNSAGISYSFSATAGTGIGNVAAALAKFESDWNTLVINPYGLESTVLDALELVNGRPDPENPTGRYQATIFKPFVSFFSKSTTDPITDVDVSARANDCTNVYCPAPNISVLSVEVAANVAYLVSQIGGNTPNLDVNDLAYPDAPVIGNSIGNYSDYEYRDSAVKAGLSTVDLSGGDVIIKDLVTTYNPTNEVTPQFRYVRNLILDWNIRYAYRLLEAVQVVNHTLIPDGTVVSAEKCISPAGWKGLLHSLFDSLENEGLIADAKFSKDSLDVSISATNPDRFNTSFRYKRTGIARICSTTAEAGFYYGA